MRVKTKLIGKFLQIIFREGSLVLTGLILEKNIVKFPELPLIRSALACLGCPLGFISQDGIIPITKTNFTLLYKCIINLATRASGINATVGSLKIAEFDNCNRRIGFSQKMS